MPDDVTQQAKDEALTRPPDAEALRSIRAAIKALPPKLRSNPLEHTISFDIGTWAAPLALLPASARSSGRISRGDVFAVDIRSVEKFFAAVYVFGMGRIGYGPKRYARIINDPGFSRNIKEAINRLGKIGPVAAYAWLYGQPAGGGRRLRAGAEGSGRIAQLGPAFFTKVLYFAGNPDGSEALILDQVVARKVHALSGMPHLVDTKGRARPWSPYRYSVYLAWMRKVAADLKEPPVLLELALFRDR
jgi:hypothetical protein